MGNRDFFLLYPERVPLLGGAALLLLSLFALPYFQTLLESPLPAFTVSPLPLKEEVPLSFSLPLKGGHLPFVPPEIAREITLSQIPLPPWKKGNAPFLVQLQGGEERLFPSLPARIDVAFEKGVLSFVPTPSLFWVELKALKGKGVEGKICLQGVGGEIEERGITLPLQLPAPQKKETFREGSPFHLLAEGRWWGRDLFLEKMGQKGGAERFEVGSAELLDLGKGNWLLWEEGRWKVASALPEGAPPAYAARLQQPEEKRLFLEGWEEGRYVRLEYPLSNHSPLKVRPEEFLSAVRIRSEKQISCMIEKQCLILRVGDWVVKREGRWKPIRSKEEREALLKGKIKGELFLLEKIEAKGGQKGVAGQLFDATRSQMIPIEVSIGTSSKALKGTTRGGR